MTDPRETHLAPAPRGRASRGARFRRRTRWAGPFALGIVAALIAVALHGASTPASTPLTQQDVNAAIASALGSQPPVPALSQRAYQAVAPAVVMIEAQIPAASPVPSSSAAPSASASPLGVSTADGSMGSGVVIDAAGEIMTCLHIVANATSIEVTFADGTKSPAHVTSYQIQNDIAVLQPDKKPANLKPAVMGNGRGVQVGSEAYVVGSPFGLSGSITSGIVSALDRSFQPPGGGPLLTGLIQVDAAVNPGSSGGPLVNRNGQVIGIVSALINPTNQGVFIGIGLAVPIDVAGGGAGLPPD